LLRFCLLVRSYSTHWFIACAFKMNKELILPSRITEAMRIALSGLVDDESDEDDIVVRRNKSSGEKTKNENKSNDNADDEQLDANAKSDPSEDLTQQTSNTVKGNRERADYAIVSSMHVEASNNAGAEEPIVTTQFNTNANFDMMDCDSLERKDLCQPPPSSNNGSFDELSTHESLKEANQRHRKDEIPEIEIIDLLSSDDEASSLPGLSGDANQSRKRKRNQRTIDNDVDGVIVIEKSFTNVVDDLVATYSRENEHKMTFALKEEILTMAIGVEPPSGDNIVRVQIKMPTGKRLVRKFKGDDQVKLIYAFVAQSNDEIRAGSGFKLLAKFPPVDLFASIDNSIKYCGLHGEAITVVYTTAVVASNGATMQRSERSIRSNEAATAKQLQRVGNDRWLKWDGLSATIEDWLRDVPPTKVPHDEVEWIYVSHTSRVLDSDRGTFNEELYRDELSKITAIKKRTKRVMEPQKAEWSNSILRIAKHCGYTSGKWIFRILPENVDEEWKKIAIATAHGKLGSGSKVAPAMDNPDPIVICCVYVSDFSNRAEVRRVLIALQQLGLKTKMCGFKPDVYTMLGIDSGNEWRLKPTIYSVDEANGWNDDVEPATY